jgi:hypothetical protein
MSALADADRGASIRQHYGSVRRQLRNLHSNGVGPSLTRDPDIERLAKDGVVVARRLALRSCNLRCGSVEAAADNVSLELLGAIARVAAPEAVLPD